MPNRGGGQALPFLVLGAFVLTLFACKAHAEFPSTEHSEPPAGWLLLDDGE
jgi:hypothetical protein